MNRSAISIICSLKTELILNSRNNNSCFRYLFYRILLMLQNLFFIVSKIMKIKLSCTLRFVVQLHYSDGCNYLILMIFTKLPFIDCSRCFKNALFVMPLLLIFSQCFRNSVATIISNICQIQFNLVYSHINLSKFSV